MSGDEAHARRPGAPGRGSVGPDPLGRRRRRLAAVVGVSAALVALGVAGAGLLVPAGESTPLVRVVAALVATAAAGALVRLDGGARAASALAIVAFAALLTCVATLPASPVAVGGGGSADVADGPPEDGDRRFGTIDDEGSRQGADGGDPVGPAALGLPPGADVRVEGGDVVLGMPDGAQIVIGQTDAAEPGTMPATDTGLVIADGVVSRDDGGAIGDGVTLGGTTFERADGGRVVVGDASLLEVPPPLAPPDDEADGLDALLAVLLGCFALVAFAPPVIRFADGYAPTVLDPDVIPDAEPADAVAGAITMEDGLAGVLRSMLADPDPRTAVIGAYGRLLVALADAGAPRRDEEGPHEHLWRSLGPLGVRRAPVHRLAELFVQARFTPRPVTEAQRQAAIAALADAVADLRLQATDVREAVRATATVGKTRP